MNFEVELYETEGGTSPVMEFQESLPPKHRAKSARDIVLLSRYGMALCEPYTKPIKGARYRGLWELRTKFASDISRIFYFISIHGRFVLVHGYLKKRNELDVRELEIAKRRRDDYVRRFHNE